MTHDIRLSALILAAALGAFLAAPATAETFRYKFVQGDTYRINSTVRENVYVNRILAHTADITNRITVSVSDVKPATGPGGHASALHDCTFMTSERNENSSFTWGREYKSVFRRDDVGTYDISDEYFMPVVRNVPTFPEGDVKPGESWTGTGEEAHDLRDTMGIEKPFKIPFNVTYTYDGPVQKDGKTLHLIRAEYVMFFNAPQKAGKTGKETNYPVSTMGYSKQKIYWDNELGLIPYYSEDFRIQMELASGDVEEFRGTAEATVTETELMDRTKAVQEMNAEITRLGIKDTTAISTEDGITLSLENIQFEADSANLLPSEKDKITKLASLLERYPNKELLVSGHTALAGTPASRQKLSEERAEAVAKFLVNMGVRDDYNVYTRGFGADKPLVPNTTEENRARNRRVEITILEK
jgi:outer membrane protein OmpA-like peptidoglycan-associated protein